MGHDLNRRRWPLIGCGVGLVLAWFAYQVESQPTPKSPIPRSQAVEEPKVPPLPERKVRSLPRAKQHVRFVSGTVVSDAGYSLTDAAVCVMVEGASPRCATADREGYFSLTAPVAAELTLTATAPGFLPHIGAVSAAEDDVTVKLTLHPGGALVAGVVLDALGGPVPNASVLVHRAEHESPEVTSTAATGAVATIADAEGRFHLNVAAGQVTLRASAEAYATQQHELTAPATGVTVVLAPASAISGRVLASGLPIEGAAVVVQPAEGRALGVGRTQTDHAGGFEVTGLATGDYSVVSERADWRSDPVSVHLTVGKATHVEIELREAAALTASVRVSDQRCSQGQLHLMGPTPKSAALATDGSVTVEGLAPGTYQAEVSCTAGAPWHESIVLPLGVTKRTWVLEPGRELRGRVRDNRGQPVAGIAVELEGAQPHTSSCVTDSNGEFACTGLAPSEYHCSASTAAGVRSEKVAVDLTASVSADITLELAASAAIRVTLDQGTEASAQQVFARQESGNVVAARQLGDEYLFERLPLGTLLVFMGNEQDPNSSRQVTLSHEKETVYVSLSPPSLETIRGLVIDAEGVPVLDAWVSAARSDALTGIYASSGAAALTDHDGRFVLTGLIPGSYDLCTRCDAEEHGLLTALTGATEVVLLSP